MKINLILEYAFNFESKKIGLNVKNNICLFLNTSKYLNNFEKISV